MKKFFPQLPLHCNSSPKVLQKPTEICVTAKVLLPPIPGPAAAQFHSDLLRYHYMCPVSNHPWAPLAITRPRGSWTSGLAPHGPFCAPTSGKELLQTPVAPFETCPIFRTPGDEEVTHSSLVKISCLFPVSL